MKSCRQKCAVVFMWLLAGFLSIFVTSAVAESVHDLPKPTDYVSDDAHVLSSDAIALLDRMCVNLITPRPTRRLPYSLSTPSMATMRQTMPTRSKTCGESAKRDRIEACSSCWLSTSTSTESMWATASKVFCRTASSAILAGQWSHRSMPWGLSPSGDSGKGVRCEGPLVLC